VTGGSQYVSGGQYATGAQYGSQYGTQVIGGGHAG